MPPLLFWFWRSQAPSTALPRSPSSKTGTIAGSEVVLYQDPEDANAEHHGGSINFGNDGKIYITTGEHFDAAEAQDLTKPRGKILRLNPDGTVPTDNPFYDGAGPNYDAIWALGLRNPYRAYYDAPTAVWLGYVYRPYYRYTAYRVIPRTYVCAGP